MKSQWCGCSLKLSALLFLWMEAIFFAFILLIVLTAIGDDGDFITITCYLTIFGTLTIIKFMAIYGTYTRKPSFLIPQLSSQIMQIALIAFVIFFCIVGFSFMDDILNFIVNKYHLPIQGLGTIAVNIMRYIIVVPMLVILGVECCFAKIVYDYYLSLISKKVTPEVPGTVEVAGLTAYVYRTSKQSVVPDPSVLSLETLI